MAGFLDKFRNNVVSSVWKDKRDEPKVIDIDDKIALGVLLWVVAEADEKFLAKEVDEIESVPACPFYFFKYVFSGMVWIAYFHGFNYSMEMGEKLCIRRLLKNVRVKKRS